MAGSSADGVSPKYTIWCAAGLAAAILIAYASGFAGEFILDDHYHIVVNPAVRTLWPPWVSMFAPINATRPVVGLSFALNYFLSGLNIWSYHALNLAIHWGAACFLMGIVRRTLRSPRADAIAFAAALLWAVHPLNTQAVAYVTQRFQCGMGFFYFGTLYAAVRVFRRDRASFWSKAGVAFCALGMWCKQDMVTAPFAVIAYDALFFSGSLPGAWRAHRRFYVGLGTTLALLVVAHFLGPSTEGWAGINPYTGLTPYRYALTQLSVIPHYVRLAFWPHPLCFDYAWPLSTRLSQAFPEGLLVVALGAATLWAYARRHPAAYLGIWFFLTLAASSSVFPISTPIWEYRAYLPLAALVTAVVLVGDALVPRAREVRGAVLTAVVAACSLITYRQVALMRDEVGLWTYVIAQRPHNTRALSSLGWALKKATNFDDAWASGLRAVPFEARNAKFHANMGDVLAALARMPAALEEYRLAVAADAADVYARTQLAYTLQRFGQNEAALTQYNEALRLAAAARQNSPLDPEVHASAGILLVDVGQWNEAEAELRRALELRPDFESARFNLGRALMGAKRPVEAADVFRSLLMSEPSNENYAYRFTEALFEAGEFAPAERAVELLLKLKPDDPQALQLQARIRQKL